MPDLDLMKQKMISRVVFDTRNIFKTSKMKEYGFHYYAIGKKI
jgi:UDPglucose 6-dehydrogenase